MSSEKGLSPVTAEIELNTARRKILSERYCRKGDPDSSTLQNKIKKFKDIGLLVKKGRYKYVTTYVVPIITATSQFTPRYTNMALDYLDLLHEAQMVAIRESIRREQGNNKISPAKIKKEISRIDE